MNEMEQPMYLGLIEPIDRLSKRGATKMIAVMEGYEPEEVAKGLPLMVPKEFYRLLNIHYVPRLMLPEDTRMIRHYIANHWYLLRQIAFHRQPFLIVVNPFRNLLQPLVEDYWNTDMGTSYDYLFRQFVRMMNYRYVMPILVANPAEQYVDIVVAFHKPIQQQESIPHLYSLTSPINALHHCTEALFEVFNEVVKRKTERKRRKYNSGDEDFDYSDV